MTYARPRRRRWPYGLVLLAVVVAAGLVAADLAARSATESAIASHARTSTHAQSVTARIRSFPFLWDVAAEGQISELTVTGRSVPAGPLQLDQVTLVAHHVHFDRHRLLSDRKVTLTSVASAQLTVVAHLSSLEQAVASALGVEIVPSGSDRLALRAGGRTVATVDLTKVPIIPTCPLSVLHTGTSYTLSCTVAPVPASVLAAISR